MSQYDHFANPILGGWDSSPNNNKVYTAILPSSDIIGDVNPSIASYELNDPRRRMAIASSKMNWSVADAVPYNVLNEILWKDAKGMASKMPKSVFSRSIEPFNSGRNPARPFAGFPSLSQRLIRPLAETFTCPFSF